MRIKNTTASIIVEYDCSRCSTPHLLLRQTSSAYVGSLWSMWTKNGWETIPKDNAEDFESVFLQSGAWAGVMEKAEAHISEIKIPTDIVRH